MGTYLLQIVETISLGRLILMAWFQLMLETDLKVIMMDTGSKLHSVLLMELLWMIITMFLFQTDRIKK